MASQTHASTDRVASVRLPAHVHDALKRSAESEHRTIAQELRRLIDQHLDHQQSEREAA